MKGGKDTSNANPAGAPNVPPTSPAPTTPPTSPAPNTPPPSTTEENPLGV